MLNILTEALSDKYLGLPTIVGVDRSDCFQHLVDRVCQRLKGWKEKFLSVQGKEILLKAVAQAIPSYAMSVFKLPKGICKAIMDEISSFWWGMERKKGKCIGMRGGRCVYQRRREEWDSETFIALTLLC